MRSGDSTPLVYVAFVLLLLASMVLRHRFLNELSLVFAKYWSAWVVAALIAFSIISAVAFPRLFAGQTSAFVATPGAGVRELPLAPVSGNITQTGYFILGALTFFAFAILMAKERNHDAVRRGFVAWAVVHATLGVVDIAGKVTGVGDALSPIRTASYSFLVDVEEAGFWRIAGGHAEASAFGSVTLSCLAFSYTYWRVQPSPGMFLLTLVLCLLLIFSTSSTAYAGLAIVAALAVVSMGIAALRGKLARQDVIVLACVWGGLILALAFYLYDEQMFNPLIALFEAVVLNKATSVSAVERGYWNSQSLQAFLDTGGVGIGLGSSRASSWIVSFLSQLGVIGSVMMVFLVAVLVWDMVSSKRALANKSTWALASAVRSSALASLAGASFSSGSADPGLLFFIALAIVVVHRKPSTAQLLVSDVRCRKLRAANPI